MKRKEVLQIKYYVLMTMLKMFFVKKDINDVCLVGVISQHFVV